MKITFFIDFDGTITKKDTCIAMNNAFVQGDWQSIDLKWQNKMLSTEEAARATFKLYNADERKLKQFLLDEIEIDEYFIPFLQYCRKKDCDIYILSDGYDFNIKTVLGKYGIKDVPFYSNELIISDKDFDVNTVHSSDSCGRCGTCKTNLINKLKPKEGLTVYVGDGYSDMCAAQKADIIFAKDHLLSYCRDNNIPAKAFNNFSDIKNWILEKGLCDS